MSLIETTQFFGIELLPAVHVAEFVPTIGAHLLL